MSEAIILALIVAVPPTLTALATLVLVLRTARGVGRVRHDINGRLDQLLQVTHNAGLAEGRQLERDLQHAPPAAPPAAGGGPPGVGDPDVIE